jgi:hypothetical protein
MSPKAEKRTIKLVLFIKVSAVRVIFFSNVLKFFLQQYPLFSIMMAAATNDREVLYYYYYYYYVILIS